MKDILTEDLINYYKKLTDYLKELDGRKTEITNKLDEDDPLGNEEEAKQKEAETKKTETEEESKEGEEKEETKEEESNKQ